MMYIDGPVVWEPICQDRKNHLRESILIIQVELCHRASWGSGDRYCTRGLMKRITRTANLDVCMFQAFIEAIPYFLSFKVSQSFMQSVRPVKEPIMFEHTQNSLSH